MSLFQTKKLVIITEKIIVEPVCELIEACGATGYTLIAAGGKGSRNIRSTDMTHVVDDLSNIKIEVIVSNTRVAERIMEQVVEQYFNNYSGITYLEEVEVLRAQKFNV